MLKSNGFLVTGQKRFLNNQFYYGVDTNPWPIELCQCQFFKEQEKKIIEELDILNSEENFACLLSFEMTKKYILECIKLKLDIRVLYCETTVTNISFDTKIKIGKAFLGYDYAYGGGDYYSCVLSDIIYRPNLFGYKDFLNEYGLIKRESNLLNFIHDREKKKKECSEPNLFEDGYFIIYKIYDSTESMIKTVIS